MNDPNEDSKKHETRETTPSLSLLKEVLEREPESIVTADPMLTPEPTLTPPMCANCTQFSLSEAKPKPFALLNNLDLKLYYYVFLKLQD